MSNYGPPPGSPQDPYGQPQDPYGQPQNPYGQPQYAGGTPFGAPPAPGGSQSVGFFGALFDFSFTNFITPKLVKFVYVLVTIVLALGWIGYTIYGFSHSAGLGIGILIGGGIIALIYLCLARMTLEFYIAIIRMSEDINKRLPTS